MKINLKVLYLIPITVFVAFLAAIIVTSIYRFIPYYPPPTVYESSIISCNNEWVDMPVEKVIPRDVGLILVTPDGFSDWETLLHQHELTNIQVQLIFDKTQSEVFILRGDASMNHRVFKYGGGDNTVDIGWRLYNSNDEYLKHLKVKMENCDRLPAIKLRLVKLL